METYKINWLWRYSFSPVTKAFLIPNSILNYFTFHQIGFIMGRHISRLLGVHWRWLLRIVTWLLTLWSVHGWLGVRGWLSVVASTRLLHKLLLVCAWVVGDDDVLLWLLLHSRVLHNNTGILYVMSGKKIIKLYILWR